MKSATLQGNFEVQFVSRAQFAGLKFEERISRLHRGVGMIYTLACQMSK